MTHQPNFFINNVLDLFWKNLHYINYFEFTYKDVPFTFNFFQCFGQLCLVCYFLTSCTNMLNSKNLNCRNTKVICNWLLLISLFFTYTEFISICEIYSSPYPVRKTIPKLNIGNTYTWTYIPHVFFWHHNLDFLFIFHKVQVEKMEVFPDIIVNHIIFSNSFFKFF